MNTSTDELREGFIKVQLDYAPRDSDKAFRAWCKSHDFDCFGLDNGREAWCSSLGTYFRGASGVAYADGEPFLFYEEDLVDIKAIIQQEQLKLLERIEGEIGAFPDDIQNYGGELRGKWAERKLTHYKLGELKSEIKGKS